MQREEAFEEVQREEAFEEGQRVGEKLGKEIGERRLAELIEKMISDGKCDEIIKVTGNAELREKMYREYHVE